MRFSHQFFLYPKDLKTREYVGLILLLVVQAIVLTWIDWCTAPTWDEWGHLPSGLYHVQYSRFQPYSVNPPLVRSIAASPVLTFNEGLPWIGMPYQHGGRPEWMLRSVFLQAKGERCFELFSWARMALIPGSWLGTYLLWSIGRRFYGATSGWIAALLWTFSPMALTFGGTVAPDVWGATFGLLAAWRFYIWLTMRTWNATIWLGAAAALALLCKSTWIILPPIFFLLWGIDRLKHNRHSLHSDAFQCLAGVFLAWLVIHAGYDFHGVLKPLGSFEFHSHTLTGHQGTDFPAGNRFADSWLGWIPSPLPADYVQGIDIQKADFEGKRQSYLLGEWQDHGWWYYYLVGIPLKEPVALWGLALLLLVGVIRRKQPRIRWREVVVFTPGIAVFIFVSSQTGFSHHLRYVMPFFLCLYLLLSRCVVGAGKWSRIAAALFCLWYAASSIRLLPHSHAFFSEAAGGAENGWRYLSDSNLDWGQDLLAIRDWSKENPEKRPIWLLYSPKMLDFQRLGINAKDGNPFIVNGVPNVAGWWVVCATPMTEDELKWFQDQPPTIQLTPTSKIIYVSPQELETLNLHKY